MKTVVSPANKSHFTVGQDLSGVNELFSAQKEKMAIRNGLILLPLLATATVYVEQARRCLQSVTKSGVVARGYNFSTTKASEVYSQAAVSLLRYQRTITQSCLLPRLQLNSLQSTEVLAMVRAEMIRLAKELPEYNTVVGNVWRSRGHRITALWRAWRCAYVCQPRLNCCFCRH